MGVAGVLITVILSHLLYSRSGYTQDMCARGWFGPRCQYKCRCVNDQCDDNGNCTSRSACRPSWFGPACQYYNLVSIGQSSHGSKDITDENDSTCNVLGDFTSMSTKWTAVYHFSWLRLRVSKPGVVHLIDVSITNNGTDTTCADLTRVAIDDHTLDIHCPTSVLMNKVELKGSGVNLMCSLYISGGRNVALQENASQSSTYTDEKYTLNYTKSDNAVNGNPSGRFEEQSCAHTGTQLRPTWNLSLRTPRLVNRYVVYNRVPTNHFGWRLRGFILESYNKNEVMVLQYREDNKTKASYTITDTNIDQQVHRVRIYLNGYATLAICEVELYGDSICPDGSYGRDCEHTCNCDNKSDSCFVSTGGCPSGCPAGFYGEGCRQVCDYARYGKGCTEMCSYNCAKVACDSISGACVDGCSLGYKPPTCNEALPVQGPKECISVPVIVGLVIVVIVIQDTLIAIGVLIWRRLKHKIDETSQTTQHRDHNYSEADGVRTLELNAVATKPETDVTGQDNSTDHPYEIPTNPTAQPQKARQLKSEDDVAYVSATMATHNDSFDDTMANTYVEINDL